MFNYYFCEMKISLAMLINKKCHSHQHFLASKCEWRLPKLGSSACCIVTTEELYNARSKMNKATGLAPGSWGAYERNEFSDSRDLHLPIDRMLNSLTWYWSLMFSLPAPFVALVYSLTSSLALLGAVFSELLRCLLSPRLRVLNIPTK